MDSQTKSSQVAETIATLKGIPLREDLKMLLEQNVLVVDFTKLNGDKRVMTCTLVESYLPPAKKDDPLSQKKVREINTEAISVWDVNANGWRSFRLDRVTNISTAE